MTPRLAIRAILIAVVLSACSSNDQSTGPGVTTTTVDVAWDGQSRSATAARVSPSFFETVEPMIGRKFITSDATESSSGVVMLGHAFWTTQLGEAFDVIGRTITVDDQPLTVVGIHAPQYEPSVEVWLLAPAGTGSGPAEASPDD